MKRQSKSIASALLGWMLLALPYSPVMASPYYDVSLEWMTTTSDVVVRGVITKIEETGTNLEASINVIETLKGTNRKSCTVLFPIQKPGQRSWEREKADLLLFLVDDTRRDPSPKSPLRALRIQVFGNRTGVYQLDKKESDYRLWLWDLSLKRLSEREEILASVRRSAKAVPQRTRPKEYRINDPFLMVPDNGGGVYVGSGVELTFPLDAQMEAQAQEWARSGKLYVALPALRHFPSEKNIEILKTLLTDVSVNPAPGRVRVFWVRKMAYDILKEWGVDVKKPVIEVPDPGIPKVAVPPLTFAA
jgi:hypothetical protein